MRYERPTSEHGTDSTDSRYAGSDPDRGTPDERKLYGEPRHEVGSDRDEQKLYGEPQHETTGESRELPDVELLFARLRAESATGPTVLPPRSGASRAETTEQ